MFKVLRVKRSQIETILVVANRCTYDELSILNKSFEPVG